MRPLKIGKLTASVPLIQGGMGVGVSLSGLSSAVANAGGVGIISTAQIGFREPDFDEHPLEANLRAIGTEIGRAKKAAPGGIIGCNIMVATRNYGEYVKAAVKAGADLIISGAGLPIRLPELTAGSETLIAPIVSTVKAASVLCRMWDRKYRKAPDLVVVEGPKAGGHLGFTEEEAENLTQEAYDEEIRGIIAEVKTYADKYQQDIPVVTAGGIYDREDVKHSFLLGADGVQVATRFVTTWECDAPMSYKQAYLDAGQEDIVIVKSPVGMPGRAIRNKFIKDREKGGRLPAVKCHQCIEHCRPAEIPYCITDALIHAVTDRTDEALLFCGANAWRADRIESVKNVVNSLFC